VDVFDNGLFGEKKVAPLGIYRSGDYWLVNSESVKIQGRYGTTQYTVNGQSALLALAVGGPFLMNHSLIIQPMDDGGKVYYDGQPILEEFPSEFVPTPAFMRLKFKEGEKHIDDVLKGYPVKLLRAYLPRNVVLTVNRWVKHVDAIIRMPQQPEGQDGHCGNFNLDVKDDTKELILNRSGEAVNVMESFFAPVLGPVNASVPLHEATLEDCSAEDHAAARVLCEGAMAAENGAVSQEVLETCIFDVCFGGDHFAELTDYD